MPIEHINKTDTLNEGREKLNAAIDGANSADITSQEADTKAAQALANSESTQTQLDTIVIEGDSSVEAAQARVDEKGESHATLKARIDDGMNSVNTQLAQTEKDLISREINVLYPPIPFNPIHADNVNDDSPIINGIIDYLSSNGGGTVFIPNVKSYTGSEIILKDNVHLRCGNNTILDAKSNNALTQITTPTPIISDLTQTSDIYVGDKTIEINNNVNAGDFVELTSMERFTSEWDEGVEIRDYYTIGELMKVESATPNSITFTDPVSFDFPLSSNRWIRTYTPTKNIGISNIQLIRDFNETGNGSAISLAYVDNFTLENIHTENANHSGILISRTIGGSAKYIKGVGGTIDLGLNYLVNINTGTKNVHVENVDGVGFRHVTTGGGSYITSMNNTFKNVTAGDSKNLSIDLHANTLNYIYEGVRCDNGINISGKGHTIKDVKSKQGSLLSTEGGKDIFFENIIMNNCTGFRSARTFVNPIFKNVELNIKSLLENISFGTNPRGFVIDNLKITNINIFGVSDNLEADEMFSSSIYRALAIGKDFVVHNLTVEGFPIGVEIVGDAFINNINLINCGWVTTNTSQPNTVIKYGKVADNSKLSNVKVSCTLPQLDISTSRVLTFSSGAGSANITIQNVSDGSNHTNNYQYGAVGGDGYDIFMQNVRPTVMTPNTAFTPTGKFIYNTVATDN